MNIFVWKWSRIAAKKIVFFFTFFSRLRFLVFFNGLFVPTSQTRMSNIFRDSESLGKSNGKNWSQIWTLLSENCLKSPSKKKYFFFTFFGLLRFLVFFNGIFDPTSRSRMSNISRDSESLGKSNGKKWSQIWTFLFENGLESPRKKKFFSSLFLVFFGFRSFLTVLLPPLPEVGCLIFLEIRNPWGKVMERSGLTCEHFLWKWSKITAQKKSFFFFCCFCLGPPSYGIGATIRNGREMLCLPYAGFF